MKYDAFISHSNKDKDFVVKLASDLNINGIKVWLDEWNLNAGDSLADTINQAIIDSRFVILVMSPDYFLSAWTQQEMVISMYKEISQKTIKTIPILYRDCSIPSVVRNKLYLDFRDANAYQIQFDKLLRDLFLIKDEKISTKSIATEVDSERVVGVNTQDVSKGDFDELKDMLKGVVDAFKNQPDIKPKEVEIDENLCFIIMPFKIEDLNVVYEYFIKPSLEDYCNMTCERGDDVFGSNVVMDDIKRSIERARIIVADLTGRNPNVFYEVGIAHTLNKPVLLLSQNIDDIPFDLRHRRVLLYEYNPKGCKKLEKDIVASINSMLAL